MKPSYVAIKENIEEMIRDGELKIGEKLPSEIKMAERFGVSRETFRSAVKLLEEDGRVLVKRGVGTFIASPLPTIPSRLEHLTSIGSMISSAGLTEGERREFIDTFACEPEWAEHLNIDEGAPVIAHQRTRTANDEPVVVSLNILPKSIVGDLFDQKNFSGSLLRFLERECGIRVVTADTQLEVPLHTDRYCQKLLIHPQTTVLLMKQLHYDELNRPILYSLDYLRNDIFKFWIRRTRK